MYVCMLASRYVNIPLLRVYARKASCHVCKSLDPEGRGGGEFANALLSFLNCMISI